MGHGMLQAARAGAGFRIESLETRRLLSARCEASPSCGCDTPQEADAVHTTPLGYAAAAEAVVADLDVNGLVSAKRAIVTATPSDIGSISDIFDADANSLYRTPAVNPIIVEINFTTPKTVADFTLRFSHAGGNPAYRWKVEGAGGSLGDGYTELVPWTGAASDVDSNRRIAPTRVDKLRLTGQRLTGDAYVHLNAWRIGAQVNITSLSVAPASVSLRQFEQRRLTATGRDDEGVSQDLSKQVAWSSSNTDVATVDAAGLVNAVGQGSATISATLGDVSGASTVRVGPPRAADLDVTYIERTPRYDYDASKNSPAPGDLVTFTGHVKNWDNVVAGPVGYRWELDGIPVAYGELTNLQPNDERTVEWRWAWQAGPHRVTLVVDPNNLVAEASESNNVVEDRTDGVIVGFWVEQSLYDYFHARQRDLNIGSNSWEDWAQRQMAKWNEQNASSIWPNTPDGVPDRVRIDKIVVVPDGALPLAGGLPTNHPDLRDKTVDMMWGFPSSALDDTFYSNTTSKDLGNPFFLEPSLRHEMGHARYLIDNYTFDVANNSDVTQVQINENGRPVAGTPLMPYLAFDSVLYYNQSGGLMTGPYGNNIWSPHEAGALARIAGRRAVSGNYNAPGNIGEYLNDLPRNNHVHFVDGAGRPLAGASVRVYAANPGPGYGGKIFDDTTEFNLTTNADGVVDLPQNPFIFGAMKEVVFRIAVGGKVWYRFFEVAEMNIQYWLGNKIDAHYTVELPDPTSPPEMDVQGFGRTVADGDTTPSLDDLTDFGDADVNGGYVIRTFIVKNRGGQTLRLTGSPRVRISGANAADFSVVYSPADAVTSETLTVFQVKFDPRGAGLRSAMVSVVDNDGNENPYNFNIQGNGTLPPRGDGAYGVKFNDLNANGVRDEGEPGLAGWRIYADANDNGRFDPAEVSTLTDADGYFELDNLPVADNHIREVPQDGWRQTAPAEGFHHFNPDIDSPPSSLDFGNSAVGVVSGRVFLDANLDRQFNPGEQEVSATVYVDLNHNGQLDPDEPNQTGPDYRFTLDVGLATYNLRTVAPAGLRVLAPFGGFFFVNLEAGQYVEDLNFGLVAGAVPRLFYNNSVFDGFDPAASKADDNAVADGKFALVPGEEASFSNISSFTRGLNGVMIDLPPRLGGPTYEITLDYFAFRSGRDGDPSAWRPGPSPIALDVRYGDGLDGGDLVTLIWRDYNPLDTSPIAQAVVNGWLQITVKAGRPTHLDQSQTFYFGNLIGEVGDGGPPFAVSAPDLARTRNAIGQPGAGRPLSATDFNRDGRTDAADLVLVRNSVGRTLPTFSGPQSFPLPSERASHRPSWPIVPRFSAMPIRDEKNERLADLHL